MDAFLASPYYGILVFGGTYALLSVFLFAVNLAIFELVTPFNAWKETFHTQNEALAHVLRGQILGQAIMISTLVYFMGISHEHGVTLDKLRDSVLAILSYGAVGVLFFQGGWFAFSKLLPLEKEIVADSNVALGKIVESFSIAFSIVLSVSLFSY